MKKISLFFLIGMYGSAHAIFDYDRAVSCGKKGDWERAASLLNNVVTDRADVAYDKGVVAHHKKEWAAAKECFLCAAEHPQADMALCERAHFNAGNACFSLKDLEGARDQYKKVLALNPDNTFAEHNLKKIEEMLKKNQQEQKKEDEKKEQEQDQEKEQDKKEEQKDNNQNKQDKQQSKNNDKQKQNNKDQSSNNGQNGQDQEKQQSPQSPSNQEEQPGQKQEPKDEQSADNKSQQQKNQRDKHEKKEDSANSGDKNKEQARGTKGQTKKDPASHDEWLAGLLAKSDKRDAQGNKKMIKAMVQQQMGGNEGQNCW